MTEQDTTGKKEGHVLIHIVTVYTSMCAMKKNILNSIGAIRTMKNEDPSFKRRRGKISHPYLHLHHL